MAGVPRAAAPSPGPATWSAARCSAPASATSPTAFAPCAPTCAPRWPLQRDAASRSIVEELDWALRAASTRSSSRPCSRPRRAEQRPTAFVYSAHVPILVLPALPDPRLRCALRRRAMSRRLSRCLPRLREPGRRPLLRPRRACRSPAAFCPAPSEIAAERRYPLAISVCEHCAPGPDHGPGRPGDPVPGLLVQDRDDPGAGAPLRRLRRVARGALRAAARWSSSAPTTAPWWRRSSERGIKRGRRRPVGEHHRDGARRRAAT